MNHSKFLMLQVPEKYIKRTYECPSHSYRSEFMRDRDRILYCQAFRKLSAKTQVYKSGMDELLRTRLTHTLEVAQIARTISNELGFDNELTEAISLGHDLGHTPFGHAGERELNDFFSEGYKDFKEERKVNFSSKDWKKGVGFKHNLQSVRVVVDLEANHDSQGHRGLNLTNYTLYGLAAHSNINWGTEASTLFYDKYKDNMEVKKDKKAWSFEAFIVALADEIAQRHHDMEDAINGRLISRVNAYDQLGEFSIYMTKKVRNSQYNQYINLKKEMENSSFSYKFSTLFIDILVTRIIDATRDNLNKFINDNKISSGKDFIDKYLDFEVHEMEKYVGYKRLDICDGFEAQEKKFKKYLKDKVIKSYDVNRMDLKGKYVIKKIGQAYYRNPQQMPDDFIRLLFEYDNTKSISEMREMLETKRAERESKFDSELLRAICDCISSMTDRMALEEYGNLY